VRALPCGAPEALETTTEALATIGALEVATIGAFEALDVVFCAVTEEKEGDVIVKKGSETSENVKV